MSRILPLLAAIGTLGSFVPTVLAADAPLTQEVHELRRDVQLQAKKIEALSEQILRLTQLMEERGRVTSITPSAPATAAPTPTVQTTETAKPKAEAEIPKAEPVTPSVQHTVAKGETLTSIAKQYNIPLSDLQKLNKITNDRKLQIGQTLNVPAPTTPTLEKTPDAPAPKKENP
jgi:LysM repeat protein